MSELGRTTICARITVIVALAISIIFIAGILLARAQSPMPRTVPLVNKSGEVVGTATLSGLRLYLRDKDGELIATIVLERNGTRTLYDPHGKVLDRIEKQ